MTSTPLWNAAGTNLMSYHMVNYVYMSNLDPNNVQQQWTSIRWGHRVQWQENETSTSTMGELCLKYLCLRYLGLRYPWPTQHYLQKVFWSSYPKHVTSTYMRCIASDTHHWLIYSRFLFDLFITSKLYSQFIRKSERNSCKCLPIVTNIQFQHFTDDIYAMHCIRNMSLTYIFQICIWFVYPIWAISSIHLCIPTELLLIPVHRNKYMFSTIYHWHICDALHRKHVINQYSRFSYVHSSYPSYMPDSSMHPHGTRVKPLTS